MIGRHVARYTPRFLPLRALPATFGNRLATGHRIPGMSTVRPKAPLRGIVEDLLLIRELADANDYRGQIIHIPL
ncbi:MAG: hypothetical protein BECKG1743D_GA0114223_101049 [Candidatus Kentron sp. G]|nr:MAG: hypothetical protein BECKG1743D_GA0114223_101049 [Candidatus Kentron sp. G]VFN02588.1 MAG: hypothetical protein BECKG1743E_GA0114224_105212 [Candidatus Kentron sp. G]VFN06393.1 MAG: hypothetical protein BECKG1743F_GA0114225_112242 [Candidatus Kentron sp. G]